MAKPELGTKRLCGNCNAKFYDLNKSPITCPKCHTIMELAAVAPRPRGDARAAVPAKDETLVPETQDAEFVSLEEADAEAQGKKLADADVIADDIEIDDEPMDDAALIEEQEESDDDVADLIGEREDNEEEP
ncbi:MAG: TIGR02300 family protein [Hyphomicrobiales bacterium]|nr:TIGR02300 family protein [Hyphomicrobiales bacterium]